MSYFFWPIAEIFGVLTPSQLWVMRFFTGISFMGLGLALASQAGLCIVDTSQCSYADTSKYGYLAVSVYLMSLVHGVLVAHAGLCLLELLPKKPWKMSVDIPFVLGQCANAMCFGLIATGLNAKAHGLSLAPGTDSSKVYSVEILTYICTAMISFFVMVTKSHWNWKENTGREFPKDPEPLTNEVQQVSNVDLKLAAATS